MLITLTFLFSKRKRARAILDFERRDDDELGFRKNDIVTIVSQRDEHCWVGELNGQQVRGGDLITQITYSLFRLCKTFAPFYVEELAVLDGIANSRRVRTTQLLHGNYF